MQSVSDLDLARGKRDSQRWNANPVLMQIVEVLTDLGGAAHRDVVIAEIAWRRSKEKASEGLRQEILAVFEAHCQMGTKMGLPTVVCRAFGATSYRWSLTPTRDI